MALVRFSYFNNQLQEKKVDSRASEINFFIDDISMSGLSKVEPFPFVFVSLKNSVFPCLSVVVLCFNREKRFDSFPK